MKKETISRELLLKAGYTEWQKDHFQKKFADDKGIKFFINVECYEFKGSNIPRMWDASIQFDTEDGSVMITTVQWFNDDGIYSQKNIQHAEHYLEKMWITNGRPYYEIYERTTD